MNEWASKLLSPLQGISDRNKADFDQFITEVNNDQLEHMYYVKELNVDSECRPTFDQLSMDRILDETFKTVTTLKALETILGERYTGFTSLNGSLLKARAAFEGFETTDGTLKLAADAFYIFSEQESTQSKQQIFLSDLKTSLNQIRHDAQKKLTDYQKEMTNAEKDVTTAEKKLIKSRESQEKGLEYRNKLEAFELDGLLQNVRGKGRNPVETKKDLDDMASRLEREVRDDIQSLLSSITKRDQVLSASRRAFQKLNRDCKRTIFYTLRKIVDKEKDFLDTRRIILEKFEQNVSQVDIDADLHDFIENHRMEDGELTLQARALSLLDDLSPQWTNNHNGQNNSNSSSGYPSSAPSPSTHQQQRASFSNLSDSIISSTTPVDPVSQAGKRTGSILGGAFSAMSNMMSNSTSSTSQATHHPPSVAPSSLSSSPSTPPNLPVGTIISSQANNGSNNSHHSNSHITNSSAAAVAAATAALHANNSSTTFPSWEFAAYLSQVFYDTGDAANVMTSTIATTDLSSEASSSSSAAVRPPTIPSDSSEDITKVMHRRARVQPNLRIQFHDVKTMGEQEFLKIETNRALVEAVEWLVTAVQTKKGRDTFITELNQFRSRKVELGGGFDALGVVLWKTLTYCQEQNDVHNSKIIMMLSQTFYRLRPQLSQPNNASSEDSTDRRVSSDDDDDDDSPKRGVEFREYIKEKLMGHAIWEDGNFWEQALWQCAIDQLQTIPYERPWYEMEKENRNETVRRVHAVLFSQVMAIIHSMMELGCQPRQTREFLYRMCVIHQLTEGQRQQLLSMVLKR